MTVTPSSALGTSLDENDPARRPAAGSVARGPWSGPGGSGVGRRVAVLLVSAALLALVPGCALAGRLLTVVDTVQTVHDLVGDFQEQPPAPPGSTPMTATVTGTGGDGLRLNARPGADRRAVLPDGTVVAVLCRTDGPQRDGPFGPTSDWLWVRIPDGRLGYMAAGYLDIGTSATAVPSCPVPIPAP
jgi:hypothetical protein